MRTKIIKLIISLFVFFPLGAISQTTQSEHPKMDKYYPRPPAEKPIANPINSAQPVMSNTPAVNNNNIVEPNTVQVPKPAEPPAEPPMETAPAVNSTPVTVQTPKLDINKTTNLERPSTVVQSIPVQRAMPQSAPGEIYNDTRLGSSSPQYDTWKKNSNGAGSVTTQSK